MPPKRSGPNRTLDILSSIGNQDFLGAEVMQNLRDHGLRGEASVFRQAKENTSRAGLNAIGMARQAALLLLAVHDIHPPMGPTSHDFYRQALDLDLRGKREFTTEILSAMGGMGRMHFSRFKALLKLSDEALELADQHNLDERVLRVILTLPGEHQPEMIQQIVERNLTAKQAEEICNQVMDTGVIDEESLTPSDIPKEAKQTIKLLRTGTKATPVDIARGLFEQEGDLVSARLLVQKLRKILDEVDSYLYEE